MKKTISITINKTVFQVDEDGYNRLEKYLKSINRHYGSSQEGKEISADIEASIAEKFSGLINSKKQSLNLKDIEKIIKIMGTVEEFSREAGSQKRSGKTRKTRIGERKLYRDPDNVIVAGVCSGLAAYFGLDPVFVRLFFLILIFFKGIALLAYFILWLVMPRAVTSGQKLAMSGKPVNLEKIEEAVKQKSREFKKESRKKLNSLSKKRSVFYKILNLPIRLLKNIVSLLKKIIFNLGPALAVFFGVIIIMAALFLMLGLTSAGGLFLFNIDSPYIVSDLPLKTLSESNLYYLALACLYLIALVPLIFIFLLGLTMTRRKNSFKAVVSGILVGLWMLAVVGAVIAAADLVPKITSDLATITKQETETRNYEYEDYDKLYLGAYLKAEIREGEEFSITMTGRKQDLDRLEFNLEEGQLQVVQKTRNYEGKFCVFCFDKEIKAEIILPRLESIVAFRNAEVEMTGFKDNIYVSLGESANLKIKVENQDIDCRLSGVSSRLELSGRTKNLQCQLDGHARLITDEEFEAERIELDQAIFSRTILAGTSEFLRAELDHYAKLRAFDLKTRKAEIKTYDFSKAEVYPETELKADAHDDSQIIYKSDSADIIKREFETGRIRED